MLFSSLLGFSRLEVRVLDDAEHIAEGIERRGPERDK